MCHQNLRAGERADAMGARRAPLLARTFAAAAVVGLKLVWAGPALAASFKDIYVFQGGTDGQLPQYGLIADQQGRLYGSTSEGGEYGYGTVFQLTPPGAGQTHWTEVILHSFSISDGVPPTGTLAMDSSGNLYGTAQSGGPSGQTGHGTVFKLANTAGWPLTILHDFGDGSSGGIPTTGVVFGPNKLLYGVTGNFGTKTEAEAGTLFSVSPAGDSVEFAVVHAFGSPNLGQNGDGFAPSGVRAVSGDTLIGASELTYPPTGYGNLFEQKVLASGSGPYEIVYSFQAPPDVNLPTMPPLPGTDAVKNMYFGVGGGGGAYGHGGIYTLTASGTNGAVENVIYSFGAQPNDGQPSQYASVIQASASGILAGTTLAGGTYNEGTFYELDPPSEPGGSWSEKIDANFNMKESSLGGYPQGSLLEVGQKIYGVLSYSKTGYGAVYQVSP